MYHIPEGENTRKSNQFTWLKPVSTSSLKLQTSMLWHKTRANLKAVKGKLTASGCQLLEFTALFTSHFCLFSCHPNAPAPSFQEQIQPLSLTIPPSTRIFLWTVQNLRKTLILPIDAVKTQIVRLTSSVLFSDKGIAAWQRTVRQKEKMSETF